MKQRYIWAILSLIAAILAYYIFRPIERHIITTVDINIHAHNSHYYFAEPKRIKLMFPDVIESMTLQDAWVQGAGDQAMEVYEMPVNTTLKMMGLQNVTIMVTADVKRWQSMHTVTIIKDFIWARVYWKVDESGPSRMTSKVHQDVMVCLPAVLWTFVTPQHHDMVNKAFTERLEQAKTALEESQF